VTESKTFQDRLLARVVVKRAEEIVNAVGGGKVTNPAAIFEALLTEKNG